MYKPKISAEFVIWGDEFDPQVISRELNVSPTEFWYKGDPIRKIERTGPNTAWVYNTGVKRTFDIDVQLMKLERLFFPRLPILQKLKEKYLLSFSINISTVVKGDNAPGIHLYSPIIQFANQLGAEIDIDYVCQVRDVSRRKEAFL